MVPTWKPALVVCGMRCKMKFYVMCYVLCYVTNLTNSNNSTNLSNECWVRWNRDATLPKMPKKSKACRMELSRIKFELDQTVA